MTTSSACPRCGVDLKPGALGDYETYADGISVGQHTDARCADRLAAKLKAAREALERIRDQRYAGLTIDFARSALAALDAKEHEALALAHILSDLDEALALLAFQLALASERAARKAAERMVAELEAQYQCVSCSKLEPEIVALRAEVSALKGDLRKEVRVSNKLGDEVDLSTKEGADLIAENMSLRAVLVGGR